MINNLYLGNCLEIMDRRDSNSIDMVLCDLPFGVTNMGWDIIIPFEQLWERYNRIMKKDSCLIFTGVQPFTSMLIMSNLKEHYFNMIWEKPQGVDPFQAKKRPLNNYEDIVIFKKGKFYYNPQMEEGEPYTVVRDKKERVFEITGTKMKETITENKGERYPKRIIKIKQERGFHPNQKPIELGRYLIKSFCREEGTVLDNTMGSGSFIVSSILENRNYIGIEQEEKYFNIAKDRVEKCKNL